MLKLNWKVGFILKIRQSLPKISFRNIFQLIISARIEKWKKSAYSDKLKKYHVRKNKVNKMAGKVTAEFGFLITVSALVIASLSFEH